MSPSANPTRLPEHIQLRLWTVAEYQAMIQASIVKGDDRVELLEGWVVRRGVRSPRNECAVSLAHNRFAELLPEGWRYRIRSSLVTADSQPAPDVAVVRGPIGAYAARHPGPDDAPLVVEVADSSTSLAHTLKARVYARAGIKTYWVVNLVGRHIEVHTDPTGPAPDPVYRTRTDYPSADSVPLLLDNQLIALIPVADLLP
jgi:Uma2 family endonuclease